MHNIVLVPGVQKSGWFVVSGGLTVVLNPHAHRGEKHDFLPVDSVKMPL